MRSMLYDSGIYRQLRENIWEECAMTDTLLNNVLANKKTHSEKPPPS